jgi:hypothetical protein
MTSDALAGKLDGKGTGQPTQAEGVGNKKQRDGAQKHRERRSGVGKTEQGAKSSHI